MSSGDAASTPTRQVELLCIPSVKESGRAHLKSFIAPRAENTLLDERLGMFSKAARAQANGKVSSDHRKIQRFKGEEAKLKMK